MEKKIHRLPFSLYQYVHIPGVSPSTEVIMFAGDRRYKSCKQRTDHWLITPIIQTSSNICDSFSCSQGTRGKVTESTSRSELWPWRAFFGGKLDTRAIPTYGVQSDHSPHTGAPVSDSRYGRLPRSHVSVATHSISWSVTRACAGSQARSTGQTHLSWGSAGSPPGLALPGSCSKGSLPISEVLS